MASCRSFLELVVGMPKQELVVKGPDVGRIRQLQQVWVPLECLVALTQG